MLAFFGNRNLVYAGFSLISGGGLRMGQVIGGTDARGDHPVGVPCTPQRRSITHSASTSPPHCSNHSGRPTHLLDNVQPIRELI